MILNDTYTLSNGVRIPKLGLGKQSERNTEIETLAESRD